MLSRRQFLLLALAGTASISAPCSAPWAAEPSTFQGAGVFNRIINKSIAGAWHTLAIGELVGKIARELEGTPYVANTLELSADNEICSVNLLAFDCITFFETTLDFARVIKKRKDKATPADLLSEVRFTRYRGGKPGDYTTRLHYTTDWFADNAKKHVVKLLSELPGSKPFTQKVGFMSSHPELSRQLTAHPELIARIKEQEEAINRRSMKFIPIGKIAAVEPLLRTGDIVGICTNQSGLDIAHTGLIMCSESGSCKFMDADSRKSLMKVVIEPEPLSVSLGRSRHSVGAIFARPLEPVQ